MLIFCMHALAHLWCVNQTVCVCLWKWRFRKSLLFNNIYFCVECCIAFNFNIHYLYVCFFNCLFVLTLSLSHSIHTSFFSLSHPPFHRSRYGILCAGNNFTTCSKRASSTRKTFKPFNDKASHNHWIYFTITKDKNIFCSCECVSIQWLRFALSAHTFFMFSFLWFFSLLLCYSTKKSSQINRARETSRGWTK